MGLKILVNNREYPCKLYSGFIGAVFYYTIDAGKYNDNVYKTLNSYRPLFKEAYPKGLMFNKFNGFPILTSKIEILRTLALVNDADSGH